MAPGRQTRGGTHTGGLPPSVRARGGFTLAEVMAAVTVLAACVLSVFGFLVWVARAGDLSDRVARATILAQDKIEDLVPLGYGGISSGSDRPQGFVRQWTVSTNSAAKTVRVTVNWISTDGVSRHVTVDSAVAR